MYEKITAEEVKNYRMNEEEKYAMEAIEEDTTRDDGKKAEICKIIGDYAYLYDQAGDCIGKMPWW